MMNSSAAFTILLALAVAMLCLAHVIDGGVVDRVGICDSFMTIQDSIAFNYFSFKMFSKQLKNNYVLLQSL